MTCAAQAALAHAQADALAARLARMSPTPEAPELAAHPSVAAPKCVECQHHAQGSQGYNSRAHFCGHPLVPRNLVTGTPTQLCTDMRNDGPAGYMPAPGAVAQRCGTAGVLYSPRDAGGAA